MCGVLITGDVGGDGSGVGGWCGCAKRGCYWGERHPLLAAVVGRSVRVCMIVCKCVGCMPRVVVVAGGVTGGGAVSNGGGTSP